MILVVLNLTPQAPEWAREAQSSAYIRIPLTALAELWWGVGRGSTASQKFMGDKIHSSVGLLLPATFLVPSSPQPNVLLFRASFFVIPCGSATIRAIVFVL